MGWFDSLVGLFGGGDSGAASVDTSIPSGPDLSTVGAAFNERPASSFEDVASSLGGTFTESTMPDVSANVSQYAPGYTPAAPNAGGGVMDTIRSGVSSFGKVAQAVQPAVNLGVTGLGIANSLAARSQMAEQGKIARDASRFSQDMSRRAADAAAPVQRFSAEQLSLAQRGEIPTATQSYIDQWKTGAKQQIRQKLASMGLGNSTALADYERRIDAEGEAMKASILKDMMGTGVQAAGQAGNILTGATYGAQTAGANASRGVSSLEQLIAQGNAQLARMAA